MLPILSLGRKDDGCHHIYSSLCKSGAHAMSSSNMSLLEREAKAPKFTTNRYQAVMVPLARGTTVRMAATFPVPLGRQTCCRDQDFFLRSHFTLGLLMALLAAAALIWSSKPRADLVL